MRAAITENETPPSNQSGRRIQQRCAIIIKRPLFRSSRLGCIEPVETDGNEPVQDLQPKIVRLLQLTTFFVVMIEINTTCFHMLLRSISSCSHTHGGTSNHQSYTGPHTDMNALFFPSVYYFTYHTADIHC